MAYRRMHQLTDLTTELTGDRQLFLLGLSAVALATAVYLPVGVFKPVFVGAAAGLTWIVVLAYGYGLIERWRGRYVSPEMRRRLEADPMPAVLTDRDGVCVAGNGHPTGFSNWSPGTPLADCLQSSLAEPKAAVARLCRLANLNGYAEHRIGVGTNASQQLRVRRFARNQLIWNLCAPPPDGELAIVRTSPDGVTLNQAAEKIFGSGHKALRDIVRDLPLRSLGKHKVRTANGDVSARIVELGTSSEGSELGIIPLVETAGMGKAEQVLAQPDLMTALPVPMIKIDEDGTLLQVNSEARDILLLDDTVGAELPPVFELFEGMGRPIMDWLADAIKGRGLLKPEIVRAAVPGQELFLQVTLGRTQENGRTVLVGILNDATELKSLEAQFVQSQKMQAIGQLAGGVAHDFNNLLTAISGHCDLLLLRHDAGDPEYADLIQISQNANRAASLVGQLLAFSRKQNLKPQALDLRDTMLDLAHLLNRLIGERIQLEVTHAPGPQMIRADRRQLEQVIVNLVVNARDAMPEGGTITVQTHSEFLPEDLLRDRARLPAGEYVVIEVQDTGVGIAFDGISKIFEPFYTTKKTGEGTGLGLSTAYGIVKQTGGFIFVDSMLNEGTTFTLYFPACNDLISDAEPEAPKPVATTTRGEGVILLVEDEAPVRAFASRALRLRGYTVVEAEDAEAALRVLDDKDLNVDVFVTDVIMPGMDGPTWVREALKARPDTRVVFMSGYAEEGRAEQQARIPNSVFLPKPFSLQQLTILVQEQLQ